MLKKRLLLLAALLLAACPRPEGPPAVAVEVVREPVKILTAGAGQIEGELTLPAGLAKGDKRPAIVLIHGSGPTDKDETVPGELTEDGQPAKLFGQLSDSLSKGGFIVLRYNKRGVIKPFTSSIEYRQNPSDFVDALFWPTISRETLMEDANRAVAFLRADPRVDGVSLLGHSEGTMIAPIIANADPSIRSLILIGAVGRNLQEIMYFQDVEQQQRTVLALVDANNDGVIAPEEVPEEFKAGLPFPILDTDKDGRVSSSELTSALEAQHKAFLAQVEAGGAREMLRGFPKGWYRSWFAAEPNLSLLPRIRALPVLIVQGEDDVQTPFLTEAKPLYDAMKKAGKEPVALKSYPGLGHGFSERKGGRPTIGPIDAQVLSDITRWARETLF